MARNKKLGKVVKGLVCVAGVTFAGMYLVARKKKSDYTYKNEPAEQNPFAGKKVVFVQDDNDDENADGVRGHLEAISVSVQQQSLYSKYGKRMLDVVLSFGGLVVLSPVYAAIALAIKIEDPGPVLFTQKRVGQNKEYFKLHKFRSMKVSTPHDVPTHQLENPEQYITKVGKFIRAHSLDELPQIWDIFVGNMSVIGPRPGLWNQDLLTAERDKYGANDVKPGLTGWAQINGRDELEIPVKAKLDGEYVQKQSLLFDVKCFLGTVSKVSHDDSVVEGGTGEMKKKSYHYTDGKSDKELIGNIGFGEPVEVDPEAKKKVLITGAGSYIGQSFIQYAKKHYPDNFEIEELDMTDAAWLDKDFSEYDVVYHVAGIAHADVGKVSEEIKSKYYEVNTGLAVEAAEKAKREGVKTFIFMSSMIVYGDSAPYGQQKVIDETTVPHPANFYGDSKLQADVAVRELADDAFKVLVLRPPMIYGKNSKGNYPILAKLAKKFPVFPAVANQRSMLYIDNLCEFLCQLMLVNEIKCNEVVLIPQNAEWTNTSQMVKEIGEVTGRKIIVIGGIMKLAVMLGGKLPNKLSGLVDKAFGNSCYTHEISVYGGLDYQKVSLTESINRTEGNLAQKTSFNTVCIINCFDTYEHRVDLLHEYFKSMGANVKVITSNYKHFEKCKRTDLKEDFEFVEAIPYTKNMSVDRLKSHSVLSKTIFRKIEHENFDLLWVLVPPNSFVKAAANYKASHSETKLIFDLIDLWPETLPISKFKSLPPFTFWKNLRDKYLDDADKIITECNLYHEKLPKKISKDKVHTIYLARELKAYKPQLNLPKDKIALCYLGSINNIIDIPTIADIVKVFSKAKPVRLHIVGDGEKRQELIETCESAGAEVLFHGKIYDSEKKQAVFNSCHYGLNIMKDSVFVGLTMKSIDYFEYGVPIINNIHGDTWTIVEHNKIGINISNSVEFKDYDVSMRTKVREYYERTFSKNNFYRNVKMVLGEIEL